ncbi:ABC transporter substrate-binding protein [Pannonibacter sp. Pt2-lr]
MGCHGRPAGPGGVLRRHIRPHPRCGASLRRTGHDLSGAGAGHCAGEPEPIHPGAQRAGTAHAVSGPRSEPRRAALLQRKGKNPLKDLRVRKAIYHAIDTGAITSKIMRGLAEPAALLVSPALFARADEFSRLAYDPAESRRLLAEAGYPEGFSLTLDCPNDRYVNDASICEAVAAMLSKAGIRTRADIQPKAKYFGRILPTGGYDTSFYLFGWTPADFDSLSLLQAVAMCRNTATGEGTFNIGGYCNEQADALIRQLAREDDKDRRADITAQIYTLINRDVAYIPLHQQKLAWGISRNFTVEQRADDQFLFRFIRQQ